MKPLHAQTWLLLVASACLAQAPTPEKLIEEGHWKRARALVEPRLKEAPADAHATFLGSQIRNAFGDREASLALAQKAVHLDRAVGRYHRQLAEAYGVMALRANIFQQVLLARSFRKEIDLAMQLDGHDVQARRDLLEFYLLAPGVVGGDAEKAGTVARQIAAMDAPEGFLAQARIAEFHKDRAQTEAMLRLAAAASPPSYKARIALAQFYLADGHRDEAAAEAHAKAALALDSDRAGAYAILAGICAGQANWSALEAILSSAAKAVPDDAAPYYSAAERLLADRRDPLRAAQYLAIYLAQEPEGNEPTASQAHWKLGLALRAQAQPAKPSPS